MLATTTAGERKAVSPRRRLFFLLWGLGILGGAAVIPFILMVQPSPLRAVGTFANAVVNVALLTWLGLRAGRSLGLGAPILERWTAGQEVKDDFRRLLPIPLIGGTVGALTVGVADLLFFLPRLPELQAIPNTAPWAHLLAALYGGFTEEIVIHLGWFTIDAWLLTRIHIGRFRTERIVAFWMANVAAALMFAGGHLPITSATLEGLKAVLTPLMTTRVLVLNGVLGMFFGHLYWTRGLEAAMLAHLATDVALAVFSLLFTTA